MPAILYVNLCSQSKTLINYGHVNYHHAPCQMLTFLLKSTTTNPDLLTISSVLSTTPSSTNEGMVVISYGVGAAAAAAIFVIVTIVIAVVIVLRR